MNTTDTLIPFSIAGLQQAIQTQPSPASGETIEPLVREMLTILGEDPDREGLEKTPERVTRMYSEILSGYRTNIHTLVNGAIFPAEYNEIVVVRGIQFYSLCEHHMLPFFGQAHVAYIPDGKIIGLSKIPRLVEMYARRLQVQERMTHQIAGALDEILHPRGVAVWVEGSHLCAMMRGVRQSEASMVTSSMLGAFQENETLRSDFFNRLRSPAAPGFVPGS